MATYKVIQDIEAEDHILGPLTLRQFIYSLVTVLFLYLSFVVVTKHAAFLLAIFLPPAMFFGFLAFPFKQDQPTEVWALAKIRFLFKPRRRIWDQSGIKELVTITVPKKIEAVLTNGLNQNEVKSRLHALADTIDSRGWAIKNVNVNLSAQTSGLSGDDSDRLLNITDSPQAVPDYDVQASDDILDEQSNPVAQHMDQMISASTQAHRQHIVAELNEIDVEQKQALRVRAAAPRPVSAPAQAQAPADYWFLQPPTSQGLPSIPNQLQPTVITPAHSTNSAPQTRAPITPQNPQGITPYDEQALLEHIKLENNTQHSSYSHLHTIQPLDPTMQTQQPVISNNNFQTQVQVPASYSQAPPVAPQALPVTPPTDAAILSLANNNDLNVATIAREAYKVSNPDKPQDEVVISLH